MKKYRLVSALILAAAFTACTQDEPFSAAGDANGEALPEGMYPLQIGSISVSAEGSGQPWTRVAETADGSGSVFTDGDVIGVSLDGNTATYTYDGSAWTSTEPLYWENTQSATVAAWFPAASTNVTLDDQTGGLAYLLKATTDNASYNTAANLTFTHQLAKVRVELSGLRASKVTGMEIYSYTSCTHTQGTVSTSGASLGWIKMKSVTYNGTKYWEANVVPGQTITQFRINESTEGTLNGSGITPAAGAMHKVSLQVNANGVPADATLITTSNCTNISGSGDYVVNGTFSSTITVTGGNPQIYLVDATVSVSSGNAINITGGNPTIHVVGENTLKDTKPNSNSSNNSGAGIYVASGYTVTITGNSQADVLIVNGGAGGCGIGGYLKNSTTAYNSGNIKIQNVTIKAYGSYESMGTCSPAIGAAGPGSCGTITIDNATVYAYGVVFFNSSSSAIGAGIDYNGKKGTYSKITIQNNSVVNVQRGNSYSDYIGSSGMSGVEANGATDATTISSTVNKLN